MDGAPVHQQPNHEHGEQVERSRQATSVELLMAHVRGLSEQLPDPLLVPHSLFFTEASASMICACMVLWCCVASLMVRLNDSLIDW